MHPGLTLGEVYLKISDLERSLTFYQDIVGLRLLRREGGKAELAADGVRPLVVLEELPEPMRAPKAVTGLYHFALLLPTRKDLGVALRRLADSGIYVGQADHLVSEALYISDPDGNGIEIYRDRPREEWTYDSNGNIRMATEPIDWEGLLREADGEEWQGIPAGTVMGHVHLHVSDLERSRRFYCEVLGFDLVTDLWRQMGALFVSAGGYHHHLGLNVWAGNGIPPAPPEATGLAYYTMILPDGEALAEVVERLATAGISVRQLQESFAATDPSGIEFRLKSSF